VGDEHGVAVPAECFVESDRIGDHGAAMNVVAVGRNLRRRASPVERGHRPEASLGQLGKEIAVGPGRIRESVQAKRQRSLAHLQVVKLLPVRSYVTRLEIRRHIRSLPGLS
jgi:hypothetical protein